MPGCPNGQYRARRGRHASDTLSRITRPDRDYPGATRYTPPDTEATRQFTDALRPDMKIAAWLSDDSFEQVLGFYRAIGKEYTPPKKPAEGKLPSGQHLRKAFVIFDGASDLVTSHQWISIQRPFIGGVTRQGEKLEYQDVRDVTEIVLTEKTSGPNEQKKKP